MGYDCKKQEVKKANNITEFTAYKLALQKTIWIMDNKMRAILHSTMPLR